jgi:serine protease
VIFYAATGNDGSSQVDYPARYPEVTAVTAGANPGQLAPYANFDPSIVRLMAPGTSLVPFGSSAWIFTGTSEASPFIAGLTAGFADSKKTSVPTAAQNVAKQPSFQVPK